MLFLTDMMFYLKLVPCCSDAFSDRRNSTEDKGIETFQAGACIH